MNPKLNKRLHALLSQQGLMEQKNELVKNATNGRVTSSSDMTDAEATALIMALQTGVRTKALSAEIQETKRRNVLKKCFALFHSLGYTKDVLPDYERIENFCTKRSKAKKPLTDMTHKELSNLIYQLESILRYGNRNNQ